MDVFVARQPILDRQQKVVGYELLFRSGERKAGDRFDGDSATAQVITNSFHLIGTEELTGGKRAFINFTENMLVNEIATILPADEVAVEILETVDPGDEVIEACLHLKEKGYMLVLDDFIFADRLQPLIKLADIVKIDFLATTGQQRKQVLADIQRVAGRPLKYLAEKVETQEDFLQARDLGYHYFQGFFFSKPMTIVSKDIPGYRLNYMKIFQELSKPVADFTRIEKIIMQDISLAYRLMKFINSAAFGFRQEIKSIRQALALLGVREFTKWFSLNLIRELGRNKPDALIINSMVRAKYAELLAPDLGMGSRSMELFLMGMFSLIDAFLERPLDLILEELAVPDLVKEGLLGQNKCLKQTLDLICAHEQGDWEEVFRLAEERGLEQEKLSEIYLQAVEWVNQVYNL